MGPQLRPDGCHGSKGSWSNLAIPRPMRPRARPGFDGRPELRPVGGGDAEPDRGAGGAEGLPRGEDHRDHGVLALLTELIFEGFGHIARHTSECTSYFQCSQLRVVPTQAQAEEPWPAPRDRGAGHSARAGLPLSSHPMDRERYYVQVARPHDSFLRFAFGGWLTQNVWLDRETAEQDAENLERAAVWVDGVDISAEAVTIARVISATELLEQEGSQALAVAEAITRLELQIRLAEQAND